MGSEALSPTSYNIQDRSFLKLLGEWPSCWLIARQPVKQAFKLWVYAGAVTIEPITASNLRRIRELTIKYADLPMDFADACLVFLGKKLNIDTIATNDRDFDVYRMVGKRPFTTLIK